METASSLPNQNVDPKNDLKINSTVDEHPGYDCDPHLKFDSQSTRLYLLADSPLPSDSEDEDNKENISPITNEPILK